MYPSEAKGNCFELFLTRRKENNYFYAAVICEHDPHFNRRGSLRELCAPKLVLREGQRTPTSAKTIRISKKTVRIKKNFFARLASLREIEFPHDM
jgi:hypothetical protein